MDKRIYNTLQKFIFRTPRYPLNFMDLDYSDILKDEYFEESIYLASTSLYNFIYKNPSLSLTNEKLIVSLYKYISRACSRCTPFGLFAGCSIGDIINFDSRHSTRENNKCKRHTRISFHIIYAIKDKIEQDAYISQKLKYYVNDTAYEMAGKLRYIEYSRNSSNLEFKYASVAIDENLEFVLEIASKGTTINGIIEYFIDRGFDKEEIYLYVNELIHSKVLVSELEPSIVGRWDMLVSIIRRLESIEDNKYLPKLKRVCELLSGIDSKETSRLHDYKKICEILQSLDLDVQLSEVFHVDLYDLVTDISVSQNTLSKIERFIIFANTVFPKYKNEEISKFKQAFHKRYEEAGVSLCEALDKELGIGYPIQKNKYIGSNPLIEGLCLPLNNGKSSYTTNSKLDKVLLKKYSTALRTNQREISISFKDFPNEKFESSTGPNHLSVLCSLIPQNDGNEFVFIKTIDTVNGASLIGRFSLNADFAHIAEKINAIEELCLKDGKFLEISHMPDLKVTNVITRANMSSCNLHYISNPNSNSRRQNIIAKDLNLKLIEGELALFSRDYSRRYYPKLTCAHNYYSSLVPVYNFLSSLQCQQPQLNISVIWNEYMLSLEYLPRVLFENIILSRQRWNLPVKNFESIINANSVDEKILLCDLIRKQLAIPQKVVLPDGDRELLIDFKNKNGILTFTNEIKKMKNVVMEEFLFDSQISQYSNECVLFFYK